LSVERTALVTLTLGGPYQTMWSRIAAPSWRRYAQRHGYDVIAIDAPLDTSPRARARSPAWQKCLVLGASVAAHHDRVVWVDADIVIHPEAPPITEGVPLGMIGAIDEYASPDPTTFREVLPRLYAAWRQDGQPFLDNPTPREYYVTRGLPAAHDQVVQTGVLVMSPVWHREVLETVYARYEGLGGARWGEMGPLSHEILQAGLVEWLDPRFNAPFAVWQALLCPDRGARDRDATLARHAAETAIERSFFLHFGGRHADMLLLLPWLRRRGLL
jgi:hypothetical protein